MNYVYLTKDGYENLKKELHELKTKGRAEAAHEALSSNFRNRL